MRYGGVQPRGGEKGLTELVSVGVAIARGDSSIERDAIRSVVGSLRAVDPYPGPVEVEGGGGIVLRRHRERSIMVVPKQFASETAQRRSSGQENNTVLTTASSHPQSFREPTPPGESNRS